MLDVLDRLPAHSHNFMRCKVCGEQTSYFSNVESDPDWAYAVHLAHDSRPPDETVPDTDAKGYADVRAKHDPRLDTKEHWWRAKALYEAGLDYDAALYLASREDVDLHDAVKLVRSAGPDLAFEILR